MKKCRWHVKNLKYCVQYNLLKEIAHHKHWRKVVAKGLAEKGDSRIGFVALQRLNGNVHASKVLWRVPLLFADMGKAG